MKKIILTILLAWCLHGFSQTDSTAAKNLRLIHKNHFGLSLGGPAFLGLYYEHFFDHNWSIETGIGSVIVVSSIYLEARYYFGKKEDLRRFAPYVGTAVGAGSIIESHGAIIRYTPLGFQFLSKQGFSFSMEAALLHFDGSFFPSGAIKIRLF
jgi:outer membrane protein W